MGQRRRTRAEIGHRLRGGRLGNAAGGQLLPDAVRADLVEFVECHQGVTVLCRRNARRLEQRRQHPPVVQPDGEIVEPECRQDLADGAEDVCVDDRRRRSHRVDVALIELPETPARGPIRAPHGLNLVALEQPGQLVPILRDDPCQRHRQIVAKREVRLAARLVLAALQNLENELVAFIAVLADERLDILERRRFQRLEPIAFVDADHHAHHVFPASNVVRPASIS